MRKLLLIALMALPTTALAVEDSSKFEAYKARQTQRRSQALEARRRYNAAKGPHVYRTAIAARAPITLLTAVEEGWVSQPAIPLIPRFNATYIEPWNRSEYSPVGHHLVSTSRRRQLAARQQAVRNVPIRHLAVR